MTTAIPMPLRYGWLKDDPEFEKLHQELVLFFGAEQRERAISCPAMEAELVVGPSSIGFIHRYRRWAFHKEEVVEWDREGWWYLNGRLWPSEGSGCLRTMIEERYRARGYPSEFLQVGGHKIWEVDERVEDWCMGYYCSRTPAELRALRCLARRNHLARVHGMISKALLIKAS